MNRTKVTLPALMVAALVVIACGKGDKPGVMDLVLDRVPQPDVLPVMQNTTPPFGYPPQIYARKLQGNVSLRLFIDTAGKVLPESTTVAESSGVPELDSLALAGSKELVFSPATRRGVAMAVSIIYPVYYRHPEAEPLPGDAAAKRGGGGEQQ